jgi:hypothetical protein
MTEELEVIEPTVVAAAGMAWPAGKLVVHVCDDKGRKDLQDMVQRLQEKQL